MERIGFVGLGRMGQAMAGRLLDAGLPLTVHNRTASRADDLLARGAAWAGSPAEVADRSDIVLTMLTDDKAVQEVYLGAGGLLAGETAGRLLVEMSTIRTSTIHLLRPKVEASGAHLLDAPVSGTLAPAREGQLMVMVGGEAADLERARPVLQVLSRRIVHVGPSGAGTTMKIVLNLPMATYWAGLAEALAIGSQHGLTPELMLDVILDSPFAPPSLHAKAPLLLGASHEVGFDVTGVRKDLLACVATGQDAGVPTAAGATALVLFAAATAAGYGKRDLVFVVEYMIEQARKTFPPQPDPPRSV
jgi:3-hydroxyisobutyrate dehydrogenase-like beta-hydroxyacid dehydrogenase